MQPFNDILTSSVLFMLDDMWNLHIVCTKIILKNILSCTNSYHVNCIDTLPICFHGHNRYYILFYDNFPSFGLSNIMASFHYLVITHCMHHNQFKTWLHSPVAPQTISKHDFRLYNYHHLSYIADESFIQFINRTSNKTWIRLKQFLVGYGKRKSGFFTTCTLYPQFKIKYDFKCYNRIHVYCKHDLYLFLNYWKRVVSNCFDVVNPIIKAFLLLVGCKIFNQRIISVFHTYTMVLSLL